jgi:hypothetical protein
MKRETGELRSLEPFLTDESALRERAEALSALPWFRRFIELYTLGLPAEDFGRKLLFGAGRERRQMRFREVVEQGVLEQARMARGVFEYFRKKEMAMSRVRGEEVNYDEMVTRYLQSEKARRMELLFYSDYSPGYDAKELDRIIKDGVGNYLPLYIKSLGEALSELGCRIDLRLLHYDGDFSERFLRDIPHRIREEGFGEIFDTESLPEFEDLMFGDGEEGRIFIAQEEQTSHPRLFFGINDKVGGSMAFNGRSTDNGVFDLRIFSSKRSALMAGLSLPED